MQVPDVGPPLCAWGKGHAALPRDDVQFRMRSTLAPEGTLLEPTTVVGRQRYGRARRDPVHGRLHEAQLIVAEDV